LGYINTVLAEFSTGINYVIVIFIAQISAFFIKQWYDDRKEHLTNIIILTYGAFFLFFALGAGLVFYISTTTIPLELYNTLFVLSILLRGTGGVIFIIVLENEFKEKFNTKYLISISLLILLILAVVTFQTLLFDPIFNLNRIIIISLPLIFTIYFLRQTHGAIRRKVWIAVLGFIFMFIGLFFLQ